MNSHGWWEDDLVGCPRVHPSLNRHSLVACRKCLMVSPHPAGPRTINWAASIAALGYIYPGTSRGSVMASANPLTFSSESRPTSIGDRADNLQQHVARSWRAEGKGLEETLPQASPLSYVSSAGMHLPRLCDDARYALTTDLQGLSPTRTPRGSRERPRSCASSAEHVMASRHIGPNGKPDEPCLRTTFCCHIF